LRSTAVLGDAQDNDGWRVDCWRVDGRRVVGSAVRTASTEQQGDYRDGLACLHGASLSMCVSLGLVP
jgi:hypothetical protein